jgi:hypothetical protein
MTINCLGRINVPTPGTPVPLTADLTVAASKVFFQVIPGLTGKTYVGTPSLVKGSLAGVARILWPNAGGGFSENFYIETQDGADSLRLADYAVDADVASEGLLVTYWQE